MTQTTTPATPGVPATTPQSSIWPPPTGTVIPFPLPWGQTGCCPPGGMDALMKCYCDIQAASAFIGQIMIDQINNNPAVTAAIIAAIEKSGSNLPLIGVTNGSDAQPGQVGEWFGMQVTVAFPTAAQTVHVSMGVLQPGDWTCWAYAIPTTAVTSMQFLLDPIPPGFSGNMQAQMLTGEDVSSMVSPTTRASISVPTLVVLEVTTNLAGVGSFAGNLVTNFTARRAR